MIEYAQAGTRPRMWGKGFLALAATVLLPGLGHFMAGRHWRAAAWFLVSLAWALGSIVSLVSPKLLLAAAVVVVGEQVLRLCSFVDAFLCGRRSERPMLGAAWLRYGAGIALILVAVAMAPQQRLTEHLRDHYVEAFSLSSGAMSPTLVPGDRFLVHKRTGWRRWSLVVIHHPQFSPGVPVATRIVGLPGETVEVINGTTRVNGEPIQAPPGAGPYVAMSYLGRDDPALRGKPGAGCEGNPIHLQDDEYFVLGDNSSRALDARLWEISADGRQLGALPARCILGRITAIYWPPWRWSLLED